MRNRICPSWIQRDQACIDDRMHAHARDGVLCLRALEKTCCTSKRHPSHKPSSKHTHNHTRTSRHTCTWTRAKSDSQPQPLAHEHVFTHTITITSLCFRQPPEHMVVGRQAAGGGGEYTHPQPRKQASHLHVHTHTTATSTNTHSPASLATCVTHPIPPCQTRRHVP